MSKQPEALRLADMLGFVQSLTPLPQEAAAELRRLHSANAELRAALNALYVAAPTSTICNDFHHSASEHHDFGAECKPLAAYAAAREAACLALSPTPATETKA